MVTVELSFFRISSFFSKDKQRSFACQGQKSVLRTLLCPQVQKKHRPSKSYNKEEAVQEGCECELELWPGIRIMKKNYILNVIAKVLKIRDTTNAALSLIDTSVF